MAIYFMPRSRVKHMKERVLPPKTILVDVSGKATDGFEALCPSYDHGGIPVPGMPGRTSRTMEAIWQGLKRFEFEGEDVAMFDSEKSKKRRAGGTRGKILGHAYEGQTINGALIARQKIYVPAYTWMIENCPAAQEKFAELVELSRANTVHVFDLEESSDVENVAPYAHAALLRDMVTRALKEGVKAPAAT